MAPLSNALIKAQQLRDAGGLSRSLVLRRQEEEGSNELPTSKPRRLSHIVLGIVSEPMVYLLLGCGALYFLIGDHQEASMLLGFLLLIIGIEIFQEQKAERALEALRDLSSPRALVLREGQKQRIPGQDVVREDLIFLNEGDRVPADALLISNSPLAADESLLTGESLPVEKSSESMVFAGTTIVRGQGLASVLAIGAQTEIGQIGKSIGTASREKTKLQSDTSRLVQKLSWVAASLCVLVFAVYAGTRHDWLQAFLVGLTLAMAILPNELPAVLTIFLALGAWRLSQRRVLTRRLPAVENLGSATVLCVDKTGTLTLNQMRIEKVFSHNQLIDLSSPQIKELPEDFHEALEFGILASRKDPFDPMEVAFLSAGGKYLQGTEHLHQDWTLQKEYPLTSELLAISHAWKPRTGSGSVIGAKGAPEAILDLCHLQKDQFANLNQISEAMAKQGLRVLGVAKARTQAESLPLDPHVFDFQFVGFIGIADPVRPEVPQAVQECRGAGIRVVMITGDHPLTASSIASKIGLQNPQTVLTGQQLAKMSEAEIQAAVQNTNVFSRVSPAQKLQLVETFKSQGEIVAMTGDGVNDAPALKSAHIGIAMGGRGTDVARESAALVLLDDDFGSIVEAVRMGRRVYSNLKSALVYLFAVHVPIAGMSILPVVFKWPLVLMPAHIALLHMVIEPASSIAFEVEPAGPLTMMQAPRNPREPLFDRKLLASSLLKGASVLAALLAVFLIALWRGQGEEDARALVFTTLVISNLTLIFLNRSSQQSLLKKFSLTGNRVAEAIAIFAMILLGMVLYSPGLRELFRFSYLHPEDWLLCFSVGTVCVLWTEWLPRKIKNH